MIKTARYLYHLNSVRRLLEHSIKFSMEGNEMSKMTTDDWERMKPYFKPEEFMIKPEEPIFDPTIEFPPPMDRSFMFTLLGLRRAFGNPIGINNGFAISGHAENSLHYQGKAADCVMYKNQKPLSLIKQAIYLLNFESSFSGIEDESSLCVGLYPFWNTPGFHIDLRQGKKSVFWIRDKSGKYLYFRDFTECIFEYFEYIDMLDAKERLNHK